MDELLTATLDELNTLETLLAADEILEEITEETLDEATELLLVPAPQFFTKVQEPSLPGILCVHQFAWYATPWYCIWSPPAACDGLPDQSFCVQLGYSFTPAQTPVGTDEILDEVLLDETPIEDIPTEETLESATLLDCTLESATLLDDALDGAMLLDDVVASHAPKSVQALLAAQPTPGS